MIISAAICPHPPLLVPAVAAGAQGLAEVRTACTAAVTGLLLSRPDLICIVGVGPAEQWYAPGAVGSFRSYGVPLDVPLGPASDAPASDAPATMPLSLTVGAWLLNESGWGRPRCALSVAERAAGDDLTRLSAQLGDLAPAVGLLVMGDGSACRTERAPGYIDPRAAAFDEAVAIALAGADTHALATLDPAPGAELLAAGTTPWRLLGRAAAGASWDATLLADVAPYGVGYFVATWTRRQ